MSNALEEYKQIKAEKKALAEKQRKLRDKLNESAEERKEVRKQQTEARKQVRSAKADLREQSSKIFEVFTSGNSESVYELAEAVKESSEQLVGAIEDFANSLSKLEDL